MKLYILGRPDNRPHSYYDVIVALVAAEGENEARLIHPGSKDGSWESEINAGWVESPEEVIVTYIGEAAIGTPKGLIFNSNAGA